MCPKARFFARVSGAVHAHVKITSSLGFQRRKCLNKILWGMRWHVKWQDLC